MQIGGGGGPDNCRKYFWKISETQFGREEVADIFGKKNTTSQLSACNDIKKTSQRQKRHPFPWTPIPLHHDCHCYVADEG